jgi:hypothetical protein
LVITLKSALRVALAVTLGAATLELISLMDRLPYSEARVALRDALSMPGGILGFLVASGGVHGDAPMLWVWSCILGNLAFYGLLWWLALVGIARLRSHGADAAS